MEQRWKDELVHLHTYCRFLQTKIGKGVNSYFSHFNAIIIIFIEISFWVCDIDEWKLSSKEFNDGLEKDFNKMLEIY